MLYLTDLHTYQLTSKAHIIDHTHCGLFLDMGLGKTAATLTAINELIYEELEISRVLVIAPKRVAVDVWPDEIAEWDHLKHLKISIVTGTEKQRLEALKKPADIYTLGKENTAWVCGIYGGLSLPFDMLVIDESSSFKNHNSIRFKALKVAQPSFKRVVLLTGTPAPNGLIDLWAQIYLLDRGQRLGKKITLYRREYFRPGQTNGSIVYNYKLRDKDQERKIHNKIKDICISMKTKDYLDLPERINRTIKIRFPDKLQKQYEAFEREKILELLAEEEEITAINAAALSNKLLQFANGAIYDEDKNIHPIHDLKLEACKELIEEAQGQSVLIGWIYRHDLYSLQGALKEYKPRELKDTKDFKDWNAGRISVALLHPQSGGHGLNLQKGGNIIIWYGQTWSPELYEQFVKRLDRQGLIKATVVNNLVAIGTREEDVIRARTSKGNIQNALMASLKARIDKYIKTV